MDNPRAFPQPLEAAKNRPDEIAGMTLRDYFAAAALTGWLCDGSSDIDVTVTKVYQIADAMLRERNK